MQIIQTSIFHQRDDALSLSRGFLLARRFKDISVELSETHFLLRSRIKDGAEARMP